MVKIKSLRRFLLPCIQATNTTSPIPRPPTKKRLSTSLRDDLDDTMKVHADNQDNAQQHKQDSPSSSSTSVSSSPYTTTVSNAPPRSSRTMVIGTIFGYGRSGHVWFCIQHDRLSTKPSLLLEFSITTSTLIQEMQGGLLRIALEFNASDSADSDLSLCPLHAVPVWTLFCNGKRLGFAFRRKAMQQNRAMLKTMQNVTVGAGVIPSCGLSEEAMYMRANYECVAGSADSESFHLINLEEVQGQELSVFLLRTR